MPANDPALLNVAVTELDDPEHEMVPHEPPPLHGNSQSQPDVERTPLFSVVEKVTLWPGVIEVADCVPLHANVGVLQFAVSVMSPFIDTAAPFVLPV